MQSTSSRSAPAGNDGAGGGYVEFVPPPRRTSTRSKQDNVLKSPQPKYDDDHDSVYDAPIKRDDDSPDEATSSQSGNESGMVASGWRDYRGQPGSFESNRVRRRSSDGNDGRYKKHNSDRGSSSDSDEEYIGGQAEHELSPVDWSRYRETPERRVASADGAGGGILSRHSGKSSSRTHRNASDDEGSPEYGYSPGKLKKRASPTKTKFDPRDNSVRDAISFSSSDDTANVSGTSSTPDDEGSPEYGYSPGNFKKRTSPTKTELGTHGKSAQDAISFSSSDDETANVPGTRMVRTQRRMEFYNSDVTERDLGTLGPGIFLNDEIINTYLGILAVEYVVDYDFIILSTHDYAIFKRDVIGDRGLKKNINREKVIRRITNYAKNMGLQSAKEADLIFIPVNHARSHWILFVVNLNKGLISYYDSMHWASVGMRYYNDINMVMKYILDVREDFQYRPREGVPQQPNGYDCGVYVCWFVKYIFEGEPLYDTGTRTYKRFPNSEEMRHVIRSKILSSGQKTYQEQVFANARKSKQL